MRRTASIVLGYRRVHGPRHPPADSTAGLLFTAEDRMFLAALSAEAGVRMRRLEAGR